MRDSRKARGDSRLKTQKAELQAEIFARCQGGKYEEVRKWLRSEWSITTSVGALSEFFSWYALRQRFAQAETHVGQLAEMVKESGLPVDASRMKDTMTALFLSIASQSGDFETFEAAFKLILKGEQIDMEKRRITLLEQKAKQAEVIEAATKGKPSAEMTQAERDAVLKVVDESFGIRASKKPA